MSGQLRKALCCTCGNVRTCKQSRNHRVENYWLRRPSTMTGIARPATSSAPSATGLRRTLCCTQKATGRRIMRKQSTARPSGTTSKR